MSFTATDSVTHEGKTNTWLTPLEIVKSLGSFDLDPCGFNGHSTADKLICLPDCGLEYKWHGRVWLNPPYGRRISLWLKRLQAHGNGIALVFARTKTEWFQSLSPDMFYFLKGRISFLNDQFKTVTNAGTGSVLMAWGTQNVNAIAASNLPGRVL